MAHDNTKIKPKSASSLVRIKNIVEGCRCGVLTPGTSGGFTGNYSSEHVYAECGHYTEDPYNKLPVIEGVWDQEKYQFLEQNYSVGKDGESDNLWVHPALWNNGTNNLLSGVFEVLAGKIYQVRGYDMANITFVKTNNISDDKVDKTDHWLVMDTLMSEECTLAALSLFDSYLGKMNGSVVTPEQEEDAKGMPHLYQKIDSMIISHSHADHYGGMSAVKEYLCTDANITRKAGGESADLSIIVPENFEEHVISENVYVGNAMSRRASYQYGSFIKPGDVYEDDNMSGCISIGIGQGQSTGKIGFEAPTYEVRTNVTLQINELKVVCQLTPGTEAPAEMNNYFPQYNALWLAENCTGTLHNLYTLRGAQIRDGKAWAKFLVEAAVMFGNDVKVVFQSHNWPHWDKVTMSDGSVKTLDLREFLLDTASIYKYINDQTLYYMNQGYKMNEAADMLTVPRQLQKNWCTKPFYGTPKHNAKAVYQKYLGWYDANPLHLEELPPEQFAQEQMRYMMSANGIEGILSMIKSDYECGNYWIAAYMAQQIILSNDNNGVTAQAKELCADALEQLGYQAESGTWRNAYLCAAYELRNGKGRVSASSSNGTVQYMTPEMLLDYIAILFDGERASSKIHFDGVVKIFEDDTISENFALIIRNGAIMYYPLADAIDLSEFNIMQATGKDMLSVKKDTLLEMLSMTQDVTKTDWDIYKILLEKDPDNAKFLKQIASCMVNLKLDRYKYFDIMGRHDSEVLIEGEEYDLKEVVCGCIKLLNGYMDKVRSGSGTLSIDDRRKQSLWNEYYSILMVNSNVLLEGDFITADNNGTLGIGNDGKFQPYEYWYTMYSLYKYLGKSYVKNDCGFQPASSDIEAEVAELTKLKKKIQILESYVPDLYLGGNEAFDKVKYQFDEGDINAWGYLAGTDDNFTPQGFYSRQIFEELYICYKQLADTLGLEK